MQLSSFENITEDNIVLYSNHCETSIKHFVINLQ